MFKTPGDILDALKEKTLKVAKLSKETGIPSSRIYKWKDRGSKITAEDSEILKNWITKLDNSRDNGKDTTGSHDAHAGVKSPMADELLDIMRERIKELKEDKDWLKKNLEFSLTGIAIGNKSILAHVATILEKDNEREAAGNKGKAKLLKEDTDRRIGEKLSGFQQTDNSLNI